MSAVTRDGIGAATVICTYRFSYDPRLRWPFPQNLDKLGFTGTPWAHPENLSGRSSVSSSDFQTAALADDFLLLPPAAEFIRYYPTELRRNIF